MTDLKHTDFNHLWSFPGLASLVCTRKELQNFLLETGGEVFAQGKLWDIVPKPLGAGVYKVQLREHK